MNHTVFLFMFLYLQWFCKAEFYSSTLRLPPLILKPFEKNRDIKIFKIYVPKHTLTFTADLTLQKVGKCSGLRLESYIQPKSLPLVRPFQVPLPPGVFLFTEALTFVYSLNKSIHSEKSSSTNINVTDETKIHIYARESGEWFIAFYISGDLQTEDYEDDNSCRVWVFPQILFHVIIPTGQLSVPYTSSTSTLNAPSPPSTDISKTTPKDPEGLTFLTLSPGKENIFSFIAPEGATSIDLILHRCLTAPWLNLTNTSTNPNLWTHVDRLEHCSVTLEMRVAGVPLSTISEVETGTNRYKRGKQIMAVTPSRPLLRRRSEKTSNTGEGIAEATFPETAKTEGKSSTKNSEERAREVFLRLEDLRGDPVPNYVYLKSNRQDAYVRLQFFLRPNFDCHTYREEIKSPLSSGDSEDSRIRISLLPWVNASWIELTPQTGLHSPITPKRNSSVNYSEDVLNPVSLPNSMQGFGPEDTLLPRCSLRLPLARSDLAIPFAFQFSFQQKFGLYENLLHLKPWHIVVIPFDLTSTQDSGGTLEVSVQLEPFEIFYRSNGSATDKIYQRQVILHACLSRSIATTPDAFTSPTRCPLWFRLATSDGLTVSVRRALADAIQAELTYSQPLHRSERMPDFEVEEDEQVDRSFIFTPYPAPGRWYLSFYAECYSPASKQHNSGLGFCASHASAYIDVMVAIRSMPCLNQRCRDIGEPASLPPGRSTQKIVTRNWRPLWWWQQFRRKSTSTFFSDPFPGDSDFDEEKPRSGEGLCTELLQQTVFTSTCSCPPGRAGLGCMPIPPPPPSSPPSSTSTQQPESRLGKRSDLKLRPALQPELAIWPSLSASAKLLVWSNIAFLPACLVAAYRGLWILFLAYLYTMIFSILYHICDTDVLVVPASLPDRVVGGSHQAFGGFAIAHMDMYKLHGYIQQQIRFAATTSVMNITSNENRQRLLTDQNAQVSFLRFSSIHCPLSHDTLSLCDFFGGVFCISVTILAASALPTRLSEVVCILIVLGLTVAVQVARFSLWFYLLPLCSLLVILISSWIYRSLQLKRLFPPVQWWIISFLPGIAFALTGLLIFVSPHMEANYTRMHSLWHIFIALSILGILPWPGRWRRALKPIIPLTTPLSCGGASWSLLSTDKIKVIRNNSLPKTPKSEDNSLMTNDYPYRHDNTTSRSMFARTTKRCNAIFSSANALKVRLEKRCDAAFELKWLLGPLTNKFPRLWWILPHDYSGSSNPAPDNRDSDHESPLSSTPVHVLSMTSTDSNC